MLDAMKDRGYVDGRRIAPHRYNAEGDIAIANAVATGNERRQRSDPYHLDHFITDCGQRQPAGQQAQAPRFLNRHRPLCRWSGRQQRKSLNTSSLYDRHWQHAANFRPFSAGQTNAPGLKRVGLVWNPAEANSVIAVGTACNSSEANSVKVISVAREAFKKRGITLEEVTATNTSEVFQAAQAACYRNVQALWVTGDNTALQSFDGIAKAADHAHHPLIFNDPEFTARGAVACVRLGWCPAGKASGVLAARVLHGENPKNIPFKEVAERKLINQQVASKLGIVFPQDVLKAAQA